jgi:sterol desaturase/sphingolipid hydroxylase (fatty acid hydroxylase superfamily)
VRSSNTESPDRFGSSGWAPNQGQPDLSATATLPDSRPVSNRYPIAAITPLLTPPRGRGRRLVVSLLVLHGLEVITLLGAARAAARLARAHPGHVAWVPTALVVAAIVVVGWQGYRLLRGREELSVPGLVVQSSILMVAIAVTAQHLIAGLLGIVVSSATLALWGRLAARRDATGWTDTDRSTDRADTTNAQPAVLAVHVTAPGPASKIGVSGIVLTVLTGLLTLGALSMRSSIVYGLAILAVIFIPLERLFTLHPQPVLRRGWRTDLVHFVVNGAAIKIGLVATVIVTAGVLRACVPAPLRLGVAASPTWVQIAAGLAITSVGGYVGHRASHEVPLLWRFHRVHHSIREMDWLAANHLHPLDETFQRATAVLPLYALGFGRLSLGVFVIVITVQSIFLHGNVRMTFGPARWLVATPHFHHWHHAREPHAYNTNYANEFPVLDVLFGTFYLPAHRWPAQYGVDDVEPAGYLRQLAWSFRAGCRGGASPEAEGRLTRP